MTCAILALTGCNAGGSDEASGSEQADSPLREYLGYSPFERGPGGGVLPGAGTSAQVQDGEQDAGDVPVMTGMSARGQDSSARSAADQRKVQNLVADCMREQGFEYVPYVPDQQDNERNPRAKASDLPPEKFAKQWGYGITTFTGSPSERTSTGSDDPNPKIREELSDKAREAYDEALFGNNGCHTRAITEIHGDPRKRGKKMENFVPLFEDLNAMVQRLDRDSEVVEARSAWSDCMADAGHAGLDKPADARRRIHEKREKLEQDEASDAERNRLEEREIALATADYECAQQGLADVRAKVAKRLESEFLEQHERALERYRDFRTRGQGSGETEEGN